jgi:hypothetical protein
MGGSVLGYGILKNCLAGAGASSKVVEVVLGARCIDDRTFSEEFLLC